MFVKTGFIAYNIKAIWVWRSLVARLNGVQEAGSSNLLTQTKTNRRRCRRFFVLFQLRVFMRVSLALAQ